MAEIDPYKTLQVDPEADDEVIRAAYRGLARKLHPDVTPGPEAAARMAAVNVAWEMIGEPEARRRYDESKAATAAAAWPLTDRKPAGSPSASGSGTGSGAPGGSGTAGGSGTGAAGSGGGPSPATPRPPEAVSPDWTSGRSTQGGGYDPSMRAPEGYGAAGPPPGQPSGSVLNFGRFSGWSLGEIARTDIEYIEWLDRAPIGRQYREELDQILRKSGRRVSAADDKQRGLFRRR